MRIRAWRLKETHCVNPHCVICSHWKDQISRWRTALTHCAAAHFGHSPFSLARSVIRFGRASTPNSASTAPAGALKAVFKELPARRLVFEGVTQRTKIYFK